MDKKEFWVGSGGIRGWGDSTRPEEFFPWNPWNGNGEETSGEGPRALAPAGCPDGLKPSPLDGRFLAG